MASVKSDIDEIIDSALLKEGGLSSMIDFAAIKCSEGKLDDAKYIFNDLVKRYPSNYYIFNYLGIVLMKKGEYEDALKAFEMAIKLSPESIDPMINIGNLLISKGELERAVTFLDRVTELDANNAYAHNLKGNAFFNMKMMFEAERSFNKVIEITSEYPDAKYNLVALLYNSKRYSEALKLTDELLEVSPDNSTYLLVKARILQNTGYIKDAIEVIKSVLLSSPSDIQAVICLANIHASNCKDFTSAKNVYIEFYKKNPSSVLLMQKFCLFLSKVMHRKECVDELDLAVSIGRKLLEFKDLRHIFSSVLQIVFLESLSHDEYEMLGSQKDLMLDAIKDNNLTSLVFSMSRVKTMDDRLQVIEYHKYWGKQLEEYVSKNPIKRKVRQRLSDKKRIGMFSSYLNNSPVGYFAWPLIEKIDRSKFELYCYSASPYVDNVRREMQAVADKFISCEANNGREVAQLMQEDHLDIVFEMGGVTANNRIEAFAYRVAPIQASWLGYPQSVGLPTSIDYIVLDKYILPEDPRLIIEKPFMMPETWVAIDRVGFDHVTISQDTPEDRYGMVTFGTLNAPYKYTKEAIAAWAEIMHMVPNSRFLCVRQNSRYQVFKDNFIMHMGRHGIAKERIIFIATDVDHLNCYNYIDSFRYVPPYWWNNDL